MLEQGAIDRLAAQSIAPQGHVIGGKHLSKGTEFVDMVRAATPDAVLAGVQVLADSVEGDVLVVDVGGATTDVYSALQPQG